jgi:CDP-6-deoxy-D-xylo-4-hexulose-3-dehydrase
MKSESSIRKEILAKVREYYAIKSKENKFKPGESYVNYAGRVYDANELIKLVDSSLDFWLTAGRYAREFEKEFARYLDVKYAFLTNSGSSANLLAISALTSPLLGDRRLMPGDEVITTACGFPTTLNPIIQNNLIPVFIDVELGTYGIDVKKIEQAISKNTKAIFVAHTLGNPNNINAIMKIAKKHDLWFIEDNCDALGSTYRGRKTGTFGDISTFSFYPAHHITMGEGGALATNDQLLRRIILSFRDWGRDCWCEPGHDDTCKRRFTQQWGQLPKGYDHKYVYSHIGYNLKVTDMQAAVGMAQLDKLPSFIRARKRNFVEITKALMLVYNQWFHQQS